MIPEAGLYPSSCVFLPSFTPVIFGRVCAGVIMMIVSNMLCILLSCNFTFFLILQIFAWIIILLPFWFSSGFLVICHVSLFIFNICYFLIFFYPHFELKTFPFSPISLRHYLFIHAHVSSIFIFISAVIFSLLILPWILSPHN